MNGEKNRKLTIIGMFCALAFIAVALCRVPVWEFLSYEPKDVIITIGGFIFGPSAVLAISIVSSLVEMLTISSTGVIGFVMNVLSTCAFAGTAAWLYKRIHTIRGAITGLIAGAVLMTIVMLLWNYLITPIYMGASRDEVTMFLIPAILPFNLLKSGLNIAITLLIYKPVVSALRKARLLPSSTPSPTARPGKMFRFNLGIVTMAIVILATCLLIYLVMKGVI